MGEICPPHTRLSAWTAGSSVWRSCSQGPSASPPPCFSRYLLSEVFLLRECVSRGLPQVPPLRLLRGGKRDMFPALWLSAQQFPLLPPLSLALPLVPIYINSRDLLFGGCLLHTHTKRLRILWLKEGLYRPYENCRTQKLKESYLSRINKLVHCHSKNGPCTHNIRFTWDSIRNANSWPKSYHSDHILWEQGAGTCVSTALHLILRNKMFEIH